MQCSTFKQKLAPLPTLKSKVPFWSTKPTQLPDYEGIGDNEFKIFYSYFILIFTKSMWSSNEIIWHILCLHWFESNFNKTWQKGIYFKRKNMNSSKSVTHISHSVSHIMDIVILTCGTLPFFHHLWINWTVEGQGKGTRNGIWNVQWLPLLLVSLEYFEVRSLLT